MAIEMGNPITLGVAEVEKCARVCEYYTYDSGGFLAPLQIKAEAVMSQEHFESMETILTVMP